MRQWFDRFSTACADWMGRAVSFAAALLACILWAACGPLFGYSDTWQLVANTSTTILTFLAVFVIQHTQNRDTLALNAKLDELVIAVAGARDIVAGIEDRSEDEIRQMKRD